MSALADSAPIENCVVWTVDCMTCLVLGHLVVIAMTAPPVRIFLLLRFAALAQIIMLSMSIVFPLVVVDGFLRAATRRDYGRSYRHCEQEWSEAVKQRPHDNSPPVRMIPSRSNNELCPSSR